MSQNDLRQEWERRIAVFRASGQPQTKWCEANELNIHQLKYWLKKIEGPKSASTPLSKWVPVTMDDQVDDSSESTIQIKMGQASIEVKSGFDPTLLANVVRTLGALC
ncbi:IS66 family insertion sequence element accessory protein TnpA [Calidifontibacillus oryziterrae]|uniref:IS66 family insertion sequence element accessory protein TnpA n=1 Tax=Calidifontibacillus oryziterrae TaxID=1191699 RepID=UPI0002E0E9F7|nr:hypothetical protein [Calidifontibacillus oryziterrae]